MDKAVDEVWGRGVGVAPWNREMLRGWVGAYAGLDLPEKGVCAGHDTPLDFLEHVFFEEKGDAVVWACRGGGKTQIAAVATLLDLLFKPGIQVRILAGSFEQAQKMYGYLREMILLGFENHLVGKPTQKKLRLINGSSVEVLAQADASVRGQRVQKLRCDEVELFDESIWQAAQLVTKGMKCEEWDKDTLVRGTVEAISTMHVPAGLMQQIVEGAAVAGRKVFKWCIWDVVEKCPRRRKCERCALWQDCQGRAKGAAGFVRIDDLLAMQGRVSRGVWEREMLCQLPRHERSVFPEFRRQTHVAERAWARLALDAGRWIGGIDFGLRQFVCLLINVAGTGPDLRVYVADEIVTEGSGLRANMEELRRWTQPANRWPEIQTLYCDVAGVQRNTQSGQSDVSLLRAAGFRVACRAMRIEPGLEQIRTLLAPALGPARLLIHPRCVRLIAAIEGYHRDETGNPVKDGTHDHCIDALRYAVCGAMGFGWKTGWRRY